jgi:hypothetical protein
VRRRAIFLAGAAICAFAAVLVALLGRDVGRRQAALRAGDAAATGALPAGDPWAADEALPWSPAGRLLGIGDDLSYRRALLLFRRAYTRDPQFEGSTDGAQARLLAETALAHEIRTDSDRRRVSAASNMLGVLSFVDAAVSATGDNSVDRSIFEFQNAIHLDPGNEQAKANLELSYRQNHFPQSVRGRERLQRSAHAGASASAPGHGY